LPPSAAAPLFRYARPSFSPLYPPLDSFPVAIPVPRYGSPLIPEAPPPVLRPLKYADEQLASEEEKAAVLKAIVKNARALIGWELEIPEFGVGT
jgi:hypothetical protein